MPKRSILAVVLLTIASALPASEDCRIWFQSLDYSLAEAGIRDTGAVRVAGHPQLRVSRWLAFLQTQVVTDDQARQWLGFAGTEAKRGWTAEILRLPEDTLALRDKPDWRGYLDTCIRVLNDSTSFFTLPRQQVPDSYADWQRVVGLYPVTATLLRPSLNGYREDMARRFKRPIRLPIRHYRPEGFFGGPPPPSEILVNPLEVPNPGEGAAKALLAHYAPVLSVSDTRIYNQPAALVLKDGEPAVDVFRPAAYTWLSWTRYKGHNLLQLNYEFWFSERPRKGALDLYGGELDSLIWRVTLKPDGNVLMYDSIHGCGCYHKVYPVSLGLRLKDKGPAAPVVYPRLSPNANHEKVSVVLEPHSHYVVRVEPFVPGQQLEQYELEPVDTLRALPDGNGGHRSLYDDRGLVPESARAERFLLWPFGVPSAGAMRQPGSHAISFLGKRHFDDPLLLDELFH